MSKSKTSGGYRALEIVLGIIAFAVGILVLAFPSIVVITLIVFFELALFTIGILRLATAASSQWLSGTARWVNAAIGIITILVAIVMALFPALAAATLIVLLGVALLIYGVGRIVVGGTANMNRGLRAFLIVLGLIIVIFSIIVIAFPSVGVYTYAFFASIIFIAIGIDSLASGIVGLPLV